MAIEPRLDIVGAALADPSRSRILCELMDGRAFTNKELACAAGITPQTATAHLKQLEQAGLTCSVRSGRHVYHRIRNEDVASTLECLSLLSPTDHLNRAGNSQKDTRLARSCYNHIAGQLGVMMTKALAERDVLNIQNDTVTRGSEYGAFLTDFGLRGIISESDKPVAKLCLDWTERRHHISGPFAIALMQKCLDAGWLVRRTGSRALTITPSGYDAFERWFDLFPEDVYPVKTG
ncbi:helix-turn-helix transcriptional regulator [uncultured Ruegeria sp.]|uniref:ArsR/SmtB family transcription factor n=1 Tax=uncultured Ruegeria sp. TaxID=259304 RepID=UPI0026052610|nr:winged helix-turn-helix domain-containing protein [uncultured Ruegeria sp.]